LVFDVISCGRLLELILAARLKNNGRFKNGKDVSIVPLTLTRRTGLRDQQTPSMNLTLTPDNETPE
jgi:hypothetical protein